jgi:murein DD-endopeptidase MepM/ murein hydrolase activator NlpD
MYYDEDRDLTFQMAHLKDRGLGKPGDRLKQGETLGYSGTAGTGPHLDMTVMQGRHTQFDKDAKAAVIDPIKAGILTKEMFQGGPLPSALSADNGRQKAYCSC